MPIFQPKKAAFSFNSLLRVSIGGKGFSALLRVLGATL